MVLFIQELLIIVLPVQVHKMISSLLQNGNVDRGIIDRCTASRLTYLPGKDQVIQGLHGMPFQERFQPSTPSGWKHCLGHRLVCAMPDHVGLRPRSQNHVESPYDDRLTCSSLCGQDIQASLKVNLKFINESKIFYR